MRHLRSIAFSLDVLVIQGFIALSWLTPLSWAADFLVASVVCVAIALTSKSPDAP